MDFFPILDLKGSHGNIGLAHGKALTAAIRENLDVYFAMVQGLTGLDPNRCLEYAGRYRDVLKTRAAHLLEEMDGIARGAGVSLDEILFLNARTEIMSMSGGSGAGECTVIGLTSERTTHGRPLIAQNWDWHETLTQTSAVFRIEPPDAPRAVYLAEAGQVGKIGVNEHGVGVVLNILITEGVGFGLPVHVMLRLILEEEDAPTAAAMIQNAPKASASHILIGDDQGRFTGLELTSTEAFTFQPENGALIHTNHYCVPEMAAKDFGRLFLPDTGHRYDRAEQLLAGTEKWDAESLAALFRDHEHGPASICRHPKPDDPPFLRSATIASVIIDPAQREMLVTHGQPCRAKYRKVALASAE